MGPKRSASTVRRGAFAKASRPTWQSWRWTSDEVLTRRSSCSIPSSQSWGLCAVGVLFTRRQAVLQPAVGDLRFQDGAGAQRLKPLHDLNHLVPLDHYAHRAPARIFESADRGGIKTRSDPLGFRQFPTGNVVFQ